MQQLQLLYLEIRQSGWTAVIAPLLVVLPFGIFLVLYLLADRELLGIAFFLLDGLLIALPLVGAALWGHLFMGNIFERSRHSFLASNAHYVSKAFVRSSMPLLFASFLSASVTALFAVEYMREIAFLAFRAGSLIVVCIAVISLCSYLFEGAYIGVAAAMVFMLLSSGAYTGLSLLPVWLTPRGGEASLGYSRLMFAVAAILLLTLLTCEKFVKRG